MPIPLFFWLLPGLYTATSLHHSPVLAEPDTLQFSVAHPFPVSHMELSGSV